MRVYSVLTDLDIDTLTEVGHAIVEKWIAFAMGRTTIHSHRVAHPTGRMASAIRMEKRGIHEISIIADEELAPEAQWLEEGHGPIDLKQFIAGRHIPMHRGRRGHYGSAGYGSPILNTTMQGRARNVWAVPRRRGFSGFATVPQETTAENADSWVIPAMTAWEPARYLADMLRSGSRIV